MKFGPLPVWQALGGILAHSIPLPSGRLRKGRVLTSDDLAKLSANGRHEVTVAMLAPDDLDENTAALTLAQALVPDPEDQGLRLGDAATGRVNIYATGAGVLDICLAKINALNNVDPAITVATLPDFQRVAEGMLVATVKIIAFAIARRDLSKAAALAQKGLRIHKPCLQRVALIETSVGDPVSNKGARVTRDRLLRLNADLTETARCAHDVLPLAAELTAAHPNADLLLILTASATSDPMDTAPQAVRTAGGTVQHVGMPVDPGNLLFLGDLHGVPVIGLPGCARSPALNGADWVLERVICGLTVNSADIAAMGVGGLLKEIPTRPQPRDIAR